MSENEHKESGSKLSGKLWEAKKCLWCGLPVSLTTYILTNDRIIIRTGLANLKEDEVRLYRVKDVGISKSFMQRLFGLGTIKISSSDTSIGDFVLKNIRDSYNRKEQISQLVEIEREKKRVSNKEVYIDTE